MSISFLIKTHTNIIPLPLLVPVILESLVYSQNPGLIAHLHVLCGLLLFRRVCKCKQHTTPEQVIGICQSLFSWKSLCLITTITAQFVIPCGDTKRAFKGQSSGLQLPCQNRTFSFYTRLLHSYSNDKSELKEHLMEPHSPVLTGVVYVCMYSWWGH